MPVRKIPRSHTSVQGHLHFNHRGWHLHFESTLERDFFILQFFDENVVDIEEQPVAIKWQDENGKQLSYVPDARIDYVDGSTKLFEVKPKRILKKKAKELAPKFAAAKGYAEQQGWKFYVVSEDDIRSARLENSKFLYHFVAESTPPHHAACFFHALRKNKNSKASVSALLNLVASTDEEKETMTRSLWRLLAQGKLQTNLDKSILPSTSISLNEQAWSVLQNKNNLKAS